jgi:outer membrane protein OmpA-like peptidoglycan-associated protein
VSVFYWTYNNEILSLEFSSLLFQVRVGASVTFGHSSQDTEDNNNNNNGIIIPLNTDGTDESEEDQEEVFISNPDILRLKNAHPGDEFDFFSIYFDNELLAPASIPILEEMAIILQENEFLIISITGYSEFLMDPQKELELSKTRARIIKNYLQSKGVKKEQIQLNPMGNIIMEKPYIGITVIANTSMEEGK